MVRVPNKYLHHKKLSYHHQSECHMALWGQQHGTSVMKVATLLYSMRLYGLEAEVGTKVVLRRLCIDETALLTVDSISERKH